jgi:hypothetical protein
MMGNSDRNTFVFDAEALPVNQGIISDDLVCRIRIVFLQCFRRPLYRLCHHGAHRKDILFDLPHLCLKRRSCFHCDIASSSDERKHPQIDFEKIERSILTGGRKRPARENRFSS